jgi:uncharacterized RDD family membrane protein YckC
MALRLLGFVVLPAIAFWISYAPILAYFSRALVSPYPRADVGRRLFAAAIDFLLVAMSSALCWRVSPVLCIVTSAGYLLLRDMLGGQSIGKLFAGLVVISLETGRPCGLAGSVRRNLLLLLPGANVVAVFLEARTIVRDPQGQRLGDRLAQTQVVEGLGARDLVKSFQERLASIGDEVGRAGGRRPGRRRPWAARKAGFRVAVALHPPV